MSDNHPTTPVYNRRQMLSLCKHGFGSLALFGLMPSFACSSHSAEVAGQINKILPNFRPRAKNIIFLYMDGGISQVDSFDPKPRLIAENGQDPYRKFKVDATQFDNIGTLLKSHWDFKQYGESGIWMSDLFPHMSTIADEIAVVRSMVSNFPEHTNANYFLHTGIGIQGRPSMGAWINYGLGSENDDLPGYVVLDGGLIPPGGVDCFKNGFLPATYQASILKASEKPLANILPTESSDTLQMNKLRFARRMDEGLLGKIGNANEVESAISNYELAYRMQVSVPELSDFTGESELTKKMYGLYSPYAHTASYGAQCLMARRLVERGVRFIELTCPNTGHDRWDQHGNLKKGHEDNARAVDQPVAALVKDLKGRGLLDETLVVFASEFGRTPFAQGKNGRDHNPSAFSIWLAGGGIKGGTYYGQTDEYGYRVAENPVEIYDLHATMLHLLGLDHEQLTFHFSGRDIRLTDVAGKVIKEIIA